MRTRMLATLILCALSGCVGSDRLGNDPFPNFVSADLFRAQVRVDGDEALPARALLQRSSTGDVSLFLRGYYVEEGEVHHWNPQCELRISIASENGEIVLDDVTRSHLALQGLARLEMGNPVLAMSFDDGRAFEGTLSADIQDDSTGAIHRIEVEIGGVLEAVECSPDSGTEPVTLGTMEFPCTAFELGALTVPPQ